MKKESIITIIIVLILVVFGLNLYLTSDLGVEEDTLYNIYNDVIVDGDYYISVGLNNEICFQKEKMCNTNSEIYKLDKDFNVIKKSTYKYSPFLGLYSVVKASDGYIATGYKDIDENLENNKGVIIKYDNDLNLVKEIEYELLDKTIFRDIVKDQDNYIIIGHSQYNEKNSGDALGGGIILKIDDDLNIIEQNNYGSNKLSGFDDIFILDDGYLVSGYEGDNSFIVKFSKNFDRDENDNKVLFSRTFDIGVYIDKFILYNNTLYSNSYKYDIDNDKLTAFNLKELVDNNILCIYNDVIYVEHYLHNGENTVIYKYDLDMNKIGEINTEVVGISKIINVNNKLLVVGVVSNNEKIYPKLYFITSNLE